MGLLQVFYNGTWGTVCEHNFLNMDARVVCRQLNYTDQIEYGTLYSNGTESGPIWLDNVKCNGQESTIAACQHNGWGINSCNHKNDIGITCYDSTFVPSTVLLYVQYFSFQTYK